MSDEAQAAIERDAAESTAIAAAERVIGDYLDQVEPEDVDTLDLAEQVVHAIDRALAGLLLIISREDLRELSAILMAERYRLDKGEGSVPQPRWGANVRIAQAVQAALDPR